MVWCGEAALNRQLLGQGKAVSLGCCCVCSVGSTSWPAREVGFAVVALPPLASRPHTELLTCLCSPLVLWAGVCVQYQVWFDTTHCSPLRSLHNLHTASTHPLHNLNRVLSLDIVHMVSVFLLTGWMYSGCAQSCNRFSGQSLPRIRRTPIIE